MSTSPFVIKLKFYALKGETDKSAVYLEGVYKGLTAVVGELEALELLLNELSVDYYKYLPPQAQYALVQFFLSSRKSEES